MKVLVTGGSGFIGSHVVDRLLVDGHDVVTFDMRPSPYVEDGQVETVIGDITDREQVAAAVAGCDAIVHMAARADVDEVIKDPVGSEAVNAQGTLSVLEAARNSSIERVLYASTIWVYDEVRDGVAHEDTAPGIPRHFYTATKLAGEMYCRSYGELYDLDYTVLRLGIPYGPRARPRAVVPAFVQRAHDGQPLTIAGSGEQSRRFVYVEDLADGIVRGLAPIAAKRIYNLVGTESTSVREVAEVVQRLVRPVEIIHLEGRTGDFSGVEISGERAANEVDWRPQTTFVEGVRRYVEWFMEEQDGAAPANVTNGAPVAAASEETPATSAAR